MIIFLFLKIKKSNREIMKSSKYGGKRIASRASWSASERERGRKGKRRKEEENESGRVMQYIFLPPLFEHSSERVIPSTRTRVKLPRARRASAPLLSACYILNKSAALGLG